MLSIFGSKKKGKTIKVKDLFGKVVGEITVENKVKLQSKLDLIANNHNILFTDLDLRDVVDKTNEILDSNIQILCFVDDEKGIVDTARKTAILLGHLAIGFYNPKEALRYLQSHINQIDLTAIDQNMPELEGSELATSIKVMNPKAKLVMMTAAPMSPISQKLNSENVDDIPIYSKPHDMFFQSLGRAFKRNTTSNAA